MFKLVLLLLSSLLVSCAAYHSPIYWGYGEYVGPDVAVADSELISILDWYKNPGVIKSIDGNSFVTTGYKKARLLPGRHVIEYVWYTGGFGTTIKGRIEIDLKADHFYEFRIKLCFWCIPRKYAVWVDDKTTGELVWGRRPDWPSWYL